MPSLILFMKLLLGEKLAELYTTFNTREWVSHGIMYGPELECRNYLAILVLISAKSKTEERGPNKILGDLTWI